MSECVVRMEMPENCTCCPMCFTADVQGYHWCAALEQEVEQGLSRPKECPIICSLPEGHGRLIDEHELFYNMFVMEDGRVLPNYDCDNFHIDMHVKDIKLRILETTTIVPAERSET